MSIAIENVDIHGWEAAIRGARNPMNSWNKSDSKFIDGESEGDYWYHTLLYTMGFDKLDYGTIDGGSGEYKGYDIIGPNDHKLLMNLCKGGSEESKWRRFVHVSMDITAPLYWWKEFETYKVGTACNSCSTLPSSYNQRRTIDLNYEVLAKQYRERKNHKLDEWREYCEFIKILPYSELITMEESDG